MTTKHHVVQSTFIFIVYTIACFIFPKVHPFSKYEMFNRFSHRTAVFVLRDKDEKIIPFSSFFNVTSDDLFQIQQSLLKTDDMQKQVISDGKEPPNETGFKLRQYLISHQTKHLPCDSFSINLLSFQYQNNELTSYEQKLYKGPSK